MSRRDALSSTPRGRPARPGAGPGPRAFSPSGAADAELRWFFNEAAIAVDQPSNFLALVAGVTFVGLEEVERRAEAVHSARKIHDWLARLPRADVLLLAGFYTERPWPRAVTRALPGGLAGAARVSVAVLAAYTRARTSAETSATDVAAFLDEIVRSAPAAVLASLREDVALACAAAVRAYERARGVGPSVVPEDAERAAEEEEER